MPRFGFAGLHWAALAISLYPPVAFADSDPPTCDTPRPRYYDAQPTGNIPATGARMARPSDTGGGLGYVHSVQRNAAQYIVHTYDELVDALAAAESGEVVYVDDCAKIDMVGRAAIVIPEGITLASGRGVQGSEGGEIRLAQMGSTYIVAMGSNARLTGLRIRGPEPRMLGCDNPNYPGPGQKCYTKARPPSTAIRIGSLNTSGFVREAVGAEVDNCEIMGWNGTAVLGVGAEARVHHNHIHHNLRWAGGYGVSVGGDSFVEVHHNLFHDNRHDVAAGGFHAQIYIARDNVSAWNSYGQAYDVHGEYENWNEEKGYVPEVAPRSQCAGAYISIHHNTLLDQERTAVTIRGTPFWGASIEYNHFAGPIDRPHDKYFPTVAQPWFCALDTCNVGTNWDPYSNEFGNLTVRNNAYDYLGYLYLPSTRRAPAVSCGTQPPWAGADLALYQQSRWLPLTRDTYSANDVGVGDFDGDGIDDLFRADGSRWYTSRSGREPWVAVNTTPVRLKDLALADFNGDHITDVFYADGARWYVSFGAKSTWTEVNSSSTMVRNMRVGDFDGDRKADVFATSGGAWNVSYGRDCFGPGQCRTSRWTQINVSGVALENLAFGDFDGNGRTDVLKSGSEGWQISWSGTSRWMPVAPLVDSVRTLLIADFDGDGRDDALRASGTRWFISRSAATAWETFEFSRATFEAVEIGDFNGDGTTDVMRAGAP